MSYENFVEFYKNVLKLTNEDFKAFLETLNTPLPHTFRVTDSPDKEAIISKLENYIDKFLTKIEYLKDVYSFEKSDIKNIVNNNSHNNNSDNNFSKKNFTDFLVAHTNIGNIQRQEIVSMIPHKFLNLKKDSRVFESCAAPGSKTKQILEIVTDGILISNDCNPQRTNVLVSEATKKSHSGFLVTCMDASSYPTISLAKFDRICCDVPCSSDGTIRKNPQIFKSWNNSKAIGLCNLQERILKRSLEMLEKDGICVYSTCSFNPIENEYVINKIIHSGEYGLIDCFKDNNLRNEDFEKNFKFRNGIEELNFGKFSFKNPALKACIRILPQDQNTGGFFIAVLKKKICKSVKNLISENLISNNLISENFTSNNSTTSVIRNNSTSFFDVSNKISDQIFDTYQITDKLISMSNRFKNIYAVSNEIYDIIKSNPKLKIVYAGVKAFNWQVLNENFYRIKSGYINKTKYKCDLEISFNDFKKLLENEVVLFSELSFKAIGLFTCKIARLNYSFCGFGSDKKVFLYIDKNVRLALQKIY